MRRKKKNSIIFILYVLMYCESVKNLTQQEKDVAMSCNFLEIQHLHLNLNNRAQLCIFLYKLDKTDCDVFQRNIICFSLKKH